MKNRIEASRSALGACLLVAGAVGVYATPAEAVVYCKYVGYPKGCVAAPPAVVVTPAPVVVAPAPVVVAPVPRAVVTPGVGAPGVGVAPGRVGNRGGPVNRVGRF